MRTGWGCRRWRRSGCRSNTPITGHITDYNQGFFHALLFYRADILRTINVFYKGKQTTKLEEIFKEIKLKYTKSVSVRGTLYRLNKTTDLVNIKDNFIKSLYLRSDFFLKGVYDLLRFLSIKLYKTQEEFDNFYMIHFLHNKPIEKRSIGSFVRTKRKQIITIEPTCFIPYDITSIFVDVDLNKDEHLFIRSKEKTMVI